MDDRDIIELFWVRSESAIEEAAKKYGNYCFYIAENILGNKQDAEEIVNDTYLRAWNSIPPDRPEQLKIYLGIIANRLALNRLRDIRRRRGGGWDTDAVIDEFAEILSDGEGELADAVALGDVFNRFLATLDGRTRDVFVRRYWYAAPIAEICREFGMNKSHVTVLMLRTRMKLKKFLQKEGFEL